MIVVLSGPVHSPGRADTGYMRAEVGFKIVLPNFDSSDFINVANL